MRRPPVLDVVLVNWNSGGDLRACLATLAAAAAGAPGLVARVVVVDNASTDGSLDGLPPGLPLEVVRNDANEGFARACNQGAARGAAPYVLFLNVDACATAPALRAPVAWLEAHPSDAVAGVQLTDAAGRVSATCGRLPRPAHVVLRSLGLDRLAPRLVPPHIMTDWAHDETRRVEHVMGAFLVIRRAVFEAVGGFDERFFVFYDDLDLARRVAEAGHGIVYLTSARAVHTGERAQSPSAVRLYYSQRAKIAYVHKHFGRAAGAAAAAATLVAEPVVRLAHAAAQRSPAQRAAALRSTRWLWRDARALWTGRAPLEVWRRPAPEAPPEA